MDADIDRFLFKDNKHVIDYSASFQMN